MSMAIRMRPDVDRYWRIRASADMERHPRRAERYAEHAVELAPTAWRNWRQLALIQYQLGDSAQAEASLVRAAGLDRGYVPHMELANLAWLLGDMPRFWTENAKALRISPVKAYPGIFNEIYHLAGEHPRQLERILPVGQAPPICGAIQFLCAHRAVKVATNAWRLMPRRCPQEWGWACQTAALTLSGAWLTEAQKSTASPPAQRCLDFWNRAAAAGAVVAPAAEGAITDGRFGYPWIGGLTWNPGQAQSLQRIRVGTGEEANRVVLAFDGSEPDHQQLFWQWVIVQPSQTYQVTFDVRGDQVRRASGLALSAMQGNGKRIWALPAQIGDSWQTMRGVFSVPANVHAILLAFTYDRPLGVPSARGQVLLSNVHMTATAH